MDGSRDLYIGDALQPGQRPHAQRANLLIGSLAAERLLQTLAARAREVRVARASDAEGTFVEFCGAARAFIDVGAVDVESATHLYRWVRGIDPEKASVRDPVEAPAFIRCIPINAPIDCGIGDGWDALAAEVLSDAIEINIAGPFPSGSTDRAETLPRLTALTLADASGAMSAATSLGHTWTSGWALGRLTFQRPLLQKDATFEIRSGDRCCLRIDARDGLPFEYRPLRRRTLTAEDAIRNAIGNSVRYGLDSSDEFAENSLAEAQRAYREQSARYSRRLAGHLVEIGALDAEHALLRQLDNALLEPPEQVRDALPVAVSGGASRALGEERVLRRVIPIATDTSVGGVRVVVRWMAVFTHMVVVVVTVRQPTVDRYGVNGVRWRLQDRWGWSRVLERLNDWWGWQWTTMYLGARRPFWKGKRIALIADAGGEEVVIPIDAGHIV